MYALTYISSKQIDQERVGVYRVVPIGVDQVRAGMWVSSVPVEHPKGQKASFSVIGETLLVTLISEGYGLYRELLCGET